MDPNLPASTSSREPLEILRKQIGDLHLSLRYSQNQMASPIGQESDSLQQLIDQAVLGVYRSTVDGELVMANMALARIFGYDSPEEMMESVTNIGTQLYVEPERRNAWSLFFQNQEMIGPVLWQGYRNNHELLWLEEHAQAIRDAHGHILGYEGVVLDVTERFAQEPLSQNVDQKVKRVPETDSADRVKENEHLRQELADAQQMIATLREQLDRFQVASIGSQEGLWETCPLPNQPWYSPEAPTWYSSQFIALLGFEEHEFPPFEKSWASRIHPDDRDRVFQALREHIENHVPYEVESRLKTKQGEYRWFKGKGQAIFDEQGVFVRGGGTIRDITNQKESEEAVKRKHALLTTVVEGTSDIIFVKDHEGRYLLVNSMGALALGCSTEEIMGKTDVEIFSKGTHPLFTKYDEDVIHKKTPQSFEIDVEDAGAVSRTFLVTKDVFVQTGEGFEGLFCIARDITFRKAAELTIREREKRYRAIMENAYDLIAEVDGSATFLYVSPNFEEVLGYAPSQLLGSNIFSFVHPEDRVGVMEEFTQGMQAAGSGRSIYRYRHQNGEYRWFESTGRGFQTALGDIRGVVVSRDITERKKSEEALEAIVKGTVTPGSQNFFQNLVRQLAQTLQVSMVFLAERAEETFPIVQGVAFWHGDRFEPKFEYDCLEGPCEKVFEGHPVYFSRGVQELFPKNSTVKALNLESYCGTPLFNSEGDIVGNLAIMDQKPLSMNAQDQSLLRVFAARAGAELERKRAQEALQKSEERYRVLYDEAPLMYFTVDSDLRVLSVNQFGANMLGYENDDLVGQSVMRVVDPEDQETFRQEIGECLTSMNQATQKVFRKVKKDGTRLWVRETSRSIVGPKQQPMLLLACEDITEHKEAENAVRAMNVALKHAMPGIALMDKEGRYLQVNSAYATLLGFSPDELLGQSWEILVHPEDHANAVAAFDVMETTGIGEFEARAVRKDGSVFYKQVVMARGINQAEGDGTFHYFMSDVTERKQMEMALRERDQKLQQGQKMEAIGTLAGGIAHDFNNILGAILGYSELALTQAKKEPKLTSYLGEVLTAGHRAKELVKQILAFSRQSDQEREAVDLNVMVQEALRMVRATLPTTIEIRSTLAMDSAVVFAATTQIHQVIMNLCANAEFAMREHGGVLLLTVTSTEVGENSTQAFPGLTPGTYLQLTIQDSGKGMSSHVLERIFEPFFTTKGLGEGTGLGLAVVHGIIVGHGGHIAASSVVGEGTTFTVLLPRLDVVLPAQIANVVEWPQGKGTILFVDDEEVLARWGEQVLTHLGYAVVTKTNPHEAVELFQSQPDKFDVVVTDQTMPTMSGEAFARALLEIRQDVPIVLCTGFSHTMSAEKANHLGLKGFLMKPVNGAVLAKTLQELLQDHKGKSGKTS